MKSKIYGFSVLLLVGIFLASCGANNSSKEIKEGAGTPVLTYDTALKSGVVTEKIVCKSDLNVTYALYLPSTYKAGDFFPVIYLFDPHAAALLPINKYKNLAEQYGYILIGCYNSKNGMPWESVHQSIKTMFDDSQARLSIDKARIYTGGFSGGSRVASSIAIFDGGIKGVIGCSAGFPQLTKQIENKFDFFGIAGNEDFNMTEMKYLDKNLEGGGIRHALKVFNGKHEWCSEEIFREAFLWIQLNEMKDRMIPVNTPMVTEINQSYQKQINEYLIKGKKYDAMLLNQRLLSFMDGVNDVSTLKKTLDSLSNLDEVKKIIAHKSEMEKQEMDIQKQYNQEYGKKDLNWWINEVNAMNIKAKSRDTEIAQMYKRILGYLSLVAYSQSNYTLTSNKLDQADYSIKLYKIIDPTNCEHCYMAATMCVMKKDSAKVIPALKEAVQLGFDDISRLQNDPSFASFKDNKDFQEILVATEKNTSNKKGN